MVNQHLKKVVFIGNSGTGKTIMVRLLTLGVIETKYVPTMGANTYSINGYEVWDTAGTIEYSGLGDGYYYGAYAFVLFEGGHEKTPEQYITNVRNICPTVPIYRVYNPTKCVIENIFHNIPK